MKRAAQLVGVLMIVIGIVAGCGGMLDEERTETVAAWATWTPGVPERTAPPRATPEAPTEMALLVCDECAEAGMKINLWAKPGGGASLAGSVPNRTRVTLLDTTVEGGRRWCKVEAGRVTGWILSEFVQR